MDNEQDVAPDPGAQQQPDPEPGAGQQQEPAAAGNAVQQSDPAIRSQGDAEPPRPLTVRGVAAVFFAAAFGGALAAIADIIQKAGDSSAFFKIGEAFGVVASRPVAPWVVFLLIVLAAAGLAFVLGARTSLDGFKVGVSVLAVAMTVTPIRTTPQLAVTPEEAATQSDSAGGAIGHLGLFSPRPAYAAETQGKAEAARVTLVFSADSGQVPSTATVSIHDSASSRTIARSTVRLTPSSENPLFPGRHTSTYVSPGSYDVVVEAEGYRPIRRAFRIDAEQQQETLFLRFDRSRVPGTLVRFLSAYTDGALPSDGPMPVHLVLEQIQAVEDGSVGATVWFFDVFVDDKRVLRIARSRYDDDLDPRIFRAGLDVTEETFLNVDRSASIEVRVLGYQPPEVFGRQAIGASVGGGRGGRRIVVPVTHVARPDEGDFEFVFMMRGSRVELVEVISNQDGSAGSTPWQFEVYANSRLAFVVPLADYDDDRPAVSTAGNGFEIDLAAMGPEANIEVTGFTTAFVEGQASALSGGRPQDQVAVRVVNGGDARQGDFRFTFYAASGLAPPASAR